MTWTLLLGLVAVTLASRILPMAFLPQARGRVGVVLDALPAPLFAALAVVSLLEGGAVTGLPVLLAAAAALIGASRRPLPLTLACGLAGFVLGRALGA